MNYQQTLDYLYKALPMFSRIGSAAYKKDLTNILALCRELGDPQEKFRTIHVGGTNGKGSVSHMLAAVLQAAGYRTGLYTSPHLYDFRERIRIDGQMVPEDFVTAFVAENRALIESVEPSFFEITVAMAFDYFAKQQVDIAVIEVGLGGRLDSTNIIRPELCVITNIGWDHMNLLGNTLEAIAFEKAGIIKPGIPVVIGSKQRETYDVFASAAKERGAPIFFAEDRFAAEDYRLSPEAIEVQVRDKNTGLLTSYITDLPGIYQKANILTVLQAIAAWPGAPIAIPTVQEALGWAKVSTGLRGRWEVLRQQPTVVLEVAHNAEGIREMLKHAARLSFNRLHLVIGMVKDKEIGKVLELLPREAVYYFTQAGIPRALDAAALRDQAAAYGLHGDSFDNVNEALRAALAAADSEDLILVCGSIFLVAEVDRAGLEPRK
ncbi:MAG TPA: folylpolyglutamate synthase/dihydrofolate synthase family protein [Flavisolibacter sp.]|nr:folylpolyglutamate synthase/dihydrofolate synthase family protein [Flavisolibacter sp.]